jgi:hypothetical protein
LSSSRYLSNLRSTIGWWKFKISLGGQVSREREKERDREERETERETEREKERERERQ